MSLLLRESFDPGTLLKLTCQDDSGAQIVVSAKVLRSSQVSSEDPSWTLVGLDPAADEGPLDFSQVIYRVVVVSNPD